MFRLALIISIKIIANLASIFLGKGLCWPLGLFFLCRCFSNCFFNGENRRGIEPMTSKIWLIDRSNKMKTPTETVILIIGQSCKHFAEVKRRKWLEDNPESSNNDFPVVFDTSIIPWWAWMKRFHLPEAERLNGRAAMIGFFMAYFVDSLTGVGLVDQMGNFICKMLLFVAVSGVLLIRKNEDLDNLKKILEETTYYDKQLGKTRSKTNKLIALFMFSRK